MSGKYPPSNSQFVRFRFKIYSHQDQAEILRLVSLSCKIENCPFNIDWVELQLHTPWPNFVSLMTPLMFSLCTSSVTRLTNVMADALLASGYRWLTITALIVFPSLFVQYLPPRPCRFHSSFPAAFCPLNQSRVRFREEVNTLVLWLGPFLQRGLYNWKALVDYFKTLVGTDSHVCAMAGNGALSFSLAFTDC